MKIVTGYPGGNDVGLAMERGEVQGRCGWSWSSVKSTHQKWIDDKKFTILVQLALDKHPDLPDVPLIIDLAKTDEQRQILKLIFARQVMGRPFLAPPGVPPDRADGAAQGVHGHDERQGFPRRRRQGADRDHAGRRRQARSSWCKEIYATPQGARADKAARHLHPAQICNAARMQRTGIRWTRRPRTTPAGSPTSSSICIKRYDFPYITLNPGASFRGLHDSLVNYGGNEPPMMLCNHEEIAVQIAHGYAKASGKPMAVILHNLVGLLHACMAIYYAYLDRVPIFIMGATGPMDEAKRRPHIDWTHTALVQGNAVRDYVKWDYQPTSIDGVPESFARAYSIMMTEPKGPVYMCYDAALQEAPKTHDVPLPPPSAVATPSPMAPDPRAIEAIADKLLKAEHPMLLPEYAGRRAGGFESIVELAETDRRRGVGRQQRAQLPQQASALPEHGQGVAQAHRSDRRPRRQGLGEAAHRTEQRQAHRANSLPPPNCDFVEIGFAEVGISKWAMDYCRMQPCSVRALGDTSLGIPELIRICRERIARRRASCKKKIADRKVAIGKRHDEVWAKWQEEARKDWDASPITFARLAHGSLGRHQGRGLGADRQRPQAAGPQALGLRQALPPSRRRARHLDPDRHLARRRARAPRQEAASWSTSSPTAT